MWLVENPFQSMFHFENIADPVLNVHVFLASTNFMLGNFLGMHTQMKLEETLTQIDLIDKI